MTILVGPGDGARLPGGVVKITGAQTGGAMAVFEQTLAPGALIPPHVHANDVWVYVLAGETNVLVGDEIATGGPGSWLLKPREIPHAMWNEGPEPSRIIEVLTPAGSEGFFIDAAELEPGDDTRFAETCARHGIRFLPDSPWLSRLRARLGL